MVFLMDMTVRFICPETKQEVRATGECIRVFNYFGEDVGSGLTVKCESCGQSHKLGK